MANLIAAATGNFTAAGTWGAVDSTSELDSEANSTAISTSNLDSSQFTPGAITVDAVAVKLAARASSPSGTFTVTLWDATASSSAAAVTVNVSDLPSAGLSWALFKFGSPATLTAGHAYDVRVTCSAAGSQVTLYRDGTSNNWSRKLRTTTTQAPAANNHLVIANELTGAGTSNSIVVTMNNTATTTWGPSTVGTQGVVVSNFGTLTFGTSASTNYYFRWRGIFQICSGGTLNIGASGGRIPVSSTVTLEMDCSSNADSRLRVDTGGDIEIWGADKNPWTTLTADAAASGTGLTVVDTTGWQASDQLGLSPTGNSVTESERRTVSVVGSSTTATIDALSFAHKGTGLVIGVVANLTRNVKFRSVSTSLRGNLHVPAAGGTAHLEAMEFVQDTLGNASIPNEILELEMTTNAVTLKKCSFNPGTVDQQTGICAFMSGGVNNFTIDNNVMYRTGFQQIYMNNAAGGNAWSITNNIMIGPSTANAHYFRVVLPSGTFTGTVTGNRVLGGQSSLSNAMNITASADWSSLDSTRFQNNELTLCLGRGLFVDENGSSNIGGALYLKNWKFYRNGTNAIVWSGLRKFILDNVDMSGNGPNQTSQGATLRSFYANGPLYMYGCTLTGDTLSTAGLGVTSLYAISSDTNNDSSGLLRIFMFNCVFDLVTGTRIAFLNGDILNSYPNQAGIQVIANNCSFGAPVLMVNLTDSKQQEIGDHIDEASSYVRCQNYNQTAGDHRTFVPQGVIKTDTAIFHQLSPSERLTPNTASFKLRSSPKIATVGISRQRTVSVWIRRSSSGDAGGANYSGNQPRLVLRRNDSIGVSVDTVLATGSVGVGTWEQLTATTPASPASEDGAMQFYVDCDGTAGWLNVDDWGIV